MTESRIKSLLTDYQFHNMLIQQFVEGITHEESVLQLPFEHNCMNWVLGHIVTNRSHVLETVDVQHDWQEEVRALYHTGTLPIKEANKSLNFLDLVVYLEESINFLQSALDVVGETGLDEIHSNYRGEKSRYQHLTGFHWHESFHLGQLQVLRAFILSSR